MIVEVRLCAALESSNVLIIKKFCKIKEADVWVKKSGKRNLQIKYKAFGKEKQSGADRLR